MANGADGSIIIDSTLDNSGFKRGSKELENAIKGLKTEVLSIGDGMKSAVQTMQTALQDMGSAAQDGGDKFRAAMDAGDMGKAMTTIQGYAQNLAKDLSKIGQAEAAGIKPGTQLESLEQLIVKTEQRLDLLKDRLFEFGNTPVGDSAAMEALQKQWDALDAEMQQVQKTLAEYRALGLPEGFLPEKDLKRAKELEEQLDAIGLKMADLEDSGQGTVWNADSEEFKTLEENYHKMTEALQVYKQALAEAKNERVAKTQELQQERAEAIQMEAQTRAAAEAEKEAVAQERAQASAARESAQSVSGLSQVLSSISSTAAHAAASLGRLVLQGVTTGIKAAGRAMTELGSALLRAGSAATSAITGLGKLGLKTIAMGAKAAAKGVGDLVAKLRSLGSHGQKATLTSNGLVKALTGFKRMLISRIKRTFISTVFKDLQSGLHSFAKYSSAFNTAMSNMKNSMTALSGNIGALAGNLITALSPALVTIIDWFSRAIEYVSAFFALISGKSTYTVAKKGTSDYAASLDKSKKSAKNAQGAVQDLKKEVYGFDELNKASGNSNSGGGSGSGAKDAEDEIQFMEKSLSSLPNGVGEFMKNLKDAFSAGEFRYVGALLSDGLDIIVKTVNDWITKTLRPKAVEWTANITEILNGLIDNFDWENLGKLTGNVLNTIIDVVKTFVKTFEFITLALSLTDYINSLIDTIEWESLGETIGTSVTNIVEGITKLESGIEWETLGANIGAGVNKIVENLNFTAAQTNVEEAGSAIAEGINSLTKTINWKLVGNKLALGFNVLLGKIRTFSKKLDITAISESFATGMNGFFDGVDWKALGETLGSGINNLTGLITGIPASINWVALSENLGTSLNTMVETVDWTTATKNAETAAAGIAKAINSLSTKVHWFSTGLSLALGFNMLTGTVKAFVKNLDIEAITTSIADGFNGFFSGVNWADLGEAVGAGTDLIINGITGFTAKINWTELSTGIGSSLNTMVEKIDWDTATRNAKASAKGIADAINSLSSSIHWWRIGLSFASGFNLIIASANTFVKNLDINKITDDVTTGLNGLLDNIEWDTLGETVGFGLGKITAAVVGFPTKLVKRSGGIGRRIGIALNAAVRSVPWATIGNNFGESMKAILEDITSFVTGVDWTKVGTSIGDLLSNIDVLDIVAKLADAIGSSVDAGLKLAGGIVDSLVSGMDSGTLSSSFENVAKSIITNLTKLLSGGVKFGTKLVTAGAKIAQTMLSSITDAFKNVKDSGLSEQFATAATQLLQNLLQTIGGLTGNQEVQTFIQNLGQSIIDGMGALGSIVGDFCGKLLGYMVNWGVLDAEEVEAAKEAGEALADNTAEAFKQAANGNPAITEGMEILVNWANWRGGQNRSEISTAAQDLVSNFNSALNGAMEESDSGEKFRDTVLENMFWSNDDWMTKALENGIDLGAENLDIEKVLSQIQIDPNAVLPNFNDLKFWDNLLEALKSGNASDIMNVVNDTLTVALAAANEKTEELVEETAASTSENARLVEETYDGIVKDTQEAVNTLEETIDQSASAMGKNGMATAIEAGTQPAKEATLKVTDEVVQLFLMTMSEENGKKIGQQFVTGILNGLTETIDDLLTSMTQYMLINGAGESELFADLGAAIDSGIAKGIKDYQSNIVIAAENAAWAAYDAACAELGIHSPSRVFADIGKFSMMGWAEGMESQENAMLKTVADLAGVTADGFNPELTLGGNDFLYGLDTIADKLHEIVDTFTALADTLNGMGGLPMPAIATGEYVPYRVRYSDDMGAAPAYGATTEFTRNFDETMSDQRDVLREILNAIRNLDLTVDGRTLERSLSNLQRDRMRAYGGG